MNLLDHFTSLRRRGADLLELAHELTPSQLIARHALIPHEARTWTKAAKHYFGPTRFTARRARVLAAARRNGHGVSTLILINDFALKCGTEAEAWQLREKLAAMDADYQAIQEAGKKATANGAAHPTNRSPRLSHRVDHDAGRMIFRLSLDMNRGRDLLHSLHARAGEPTGAGLTEEDKGRALLEIITGDGGISETTLTPLVVVGAPDLSRILDGEGDDIVLALSDGTTITGADFLSARMAEHSFVGLYHPETGPANLYRTARFFTRKQRTLAKGESPVCAWPDCTKAADSCQTHHLTDWAKGGHTNSSDAASLCQYHNRINGLPGRGRIIRDADGKLKWQPPFGGQPRSKDHPASRRGAMHLI